MNIDRPCLYLSRIKYNTVGCSFKRESWMDVRSFWWILCVKNESCTLASIKIGRLKRQLTSSAPYQLECDQRQHALNDFFFFVATYLQKKVCDSQFLINGTAAIVDCWFISGSLLLLLSPLESEHFSFWQQEKKKYSPFDFWAAFITMRAASHNRAWQILARDSPLSPRPIFKCQKWAMVQFAAIDRWPGPRPFTHQSPIFSGSVKNKTSGGWSRERRERKGRTQMSRQLSQFLETTVCWLPSQRKKAPAIGRWVEASRDTPKGWKHSLFNVLSPFIEKDVMRRREP